LKKTLHVGQDRRRSEAMAKPKFIQLGAALALLAFAAVNTLPTTAEAQGRKFGFGTATATAGAATLNQESGVVTSEALVTAAAGLYTLTITNATVETINAVVLASLANGTNSQGTPQIMRVTPAAGSVVIVVQNTHASVALNGTIKIAYAVISR
jgi:hypothetical protein